MKKKLLYLIPIIILFILLTYILIHEKTNKKDIRNKNTNNIIENINYKTLENKNNIQKQYTFNIKELNNKENSLNFLVNNHYTEVYIDNELVYEMNISKNNNIIKTTYKYWVNIPLNNNDIDKEIKIILTPIRNTITNNDIELKIISKYDLFIEMLKNNIFIILFSIINIILGLYLLITNKKLTSSLNIFMGLSYLTINDLIILLINKNIILGTINILSILISIILLIPTIKTIIKEKNIYIKLLITTVIIDILTYILFKATLIYTPILLTIYSINKYIKKKSDQ